MLIKTAFRILVHEKGKYIGVTIGIAMALFLMLLQFGFYLGFRKDITVVADSFDADLWISQRALLAFDYVAEFDDAPHFLALSDMAVAAATPVVVGFTRMRRLGDGATEDGQLVGLDFSSGVKFDLGSTSQPTAELSVPGHVLIDEKHRARLGVKGTDETGVEIQGLHANIVGYVFGKKLFTTACLTITDLDNGRRFLGLKANQTSFVAVKCNAGADIRAVQERLQARMPEYRVWRAQQFHDLTQDYWVKLTGIGPVLLLSAALAALVGFLTVFLTFSHLTSEKLPVYAALKAIGASTSELAGLILVQIGVVFGIGCVFAMSGVLIAIYALARTSISLVLTPQIAFIGIASMAICSLGAGWRALHRLARVEPAEAFKA